MYNRRKIGILVKLKLSPKTAKIPLIICTTNMKVVRESEVKLAEKGVLILPKPFDIDDLLNTINKVNNKPIIKGPHKNPGV